MKPVNNDFPAIDIPEKKLPMIVEGAIVHDTRVYPPRVFRATNVLHLVNETSFDAICVVSNERLQGYSLKGMADVPQHWHILTNELEIIARLSLSRDEWLRWYRSLPKEIR